ncbi:MAG: hypothetical protein J6R77_04675 [Clostridia bacterium]|nr:hypothetical protein [Clostridia bacterium]
MNTKKAQKLSRALETVRDGYYAKAMDQPYSKLQLTAALQHIEDMCQYIDKHSDDVEREFLFCCFDTLDDLQEEGDFLKISRFAEAIHRVPLLFCGEETWNPAFRRQYLIPFCQMYGDEWLEDVLAMHIPKKTDAQKPTKTIYRYNEFNISSLPGYFCFRMLLPLLTLPVLLGLMVYVHFSDYTEADHGERYEITVTDYEWGHDEENDYLTIFCKEFEEPFEIGRFLQYSHSPEELIARCEAGEKLVVYVEYKQPRRSDPYYDLIHLESVDGTVYRSYEHENELDRYTLLFLLIACLVIFVPFFLLFLMMLMVAINPGRFVAHPRFVKFCFPDYSLSLKEDK